MKAQKPFQRPANSCGKIFVKLSSWYLQASKNIFFSSNTSGLFGLYEGQLNLPSWIYVLERQNIDFIYKVAENELNLLYFHHLLLGMFTVIVVRSHLRQIILSTLQLLEAQYFFEKLQNEQCFVLPINYGIPYPPCKKTAIHSQKIIAFYLGTIINHCWKEYLKLNFKPDRMVPSTIRTVDLTKCLPSCLTKISHKFDIPETFS